MDAAKTLRAAGKRVAVISMPCWDLFEAQPEDYRKGGARDRPADRDRGGARGSAGTAGSASAASSLA